MTGERPYLSDLPSWISLLDAARLVVGLQTGDAELADAMTDPWIRKAAYAYDTTVARAAYVSAIEALSAAMRAGRIRGRGRPPSEDRDREIEAHEWASYSCDFREGGLVSFHCAPRFIRLSLIETESLLAALGVKRAPAGTDAAQSKGGRKPDVAEETIDRLVFELMDHHGEFSADDPEWNAQARLEDKVRTLAVQQTGKDPSTSTVREYVRKSLKKWRAQKAVQTET